MFHGLADTTQQQPQQPQIQPPAAQPAQQPGLDQAQANQLAQQPQAQGQQLIPFNGTVSVEGHPVQVKNGIAQFDGQEFNVFKVPGSELDLVIGPGGQFVGIVQGGQFVPATPEMIAQLKQQGILQ
jgi:hypothetical protein